VALTVEQMKAMARGEWRHGPGDVAESKYPHPATRTRTENGLMDVEYFEWHAIRTSNNKWYVVRPCRHGKYFGIDIRVYYIFRRENPTTRQKVETPLLTKKGIFVATQNATDVFGKVQELLEASYGKDKFGYVGPYKGEYAKPSDAGDAPAPDPLHLPQ